MNTRKLAILWSVLALLIAGCGNENDLTENTPNGSHGNISEEIVSESNVTYDVPDYLNTDSILPIVKDGTDITLKVMISQGPYYSNMNSIREVYFVDAYDSKTNVKIEWIEVPAESFGDRFALATVSGDLPDIVIKAGFSNSAQQRYGNQGFFLDLMKNNLLENHAPNYWKLAQKHPEILAASRMPSGEVYSLGMVRNSSGSLVASKLFFNKDWLSKLNLTVPSTADEFTNVLYEFRHSDPNGNGLNDEAGLYIKPDHLEMVTFGMFGMGNRGRNNGYIDWDGQNEKVRYFAISDEYRQWVSWVAKLYKDGLLEREYFDFTESKLGSLVMNDVCGVFAYTNLSMLDEQKQNQFTYLNNTMSGKLGENGWFGVNSIGSTGSYVITSACEYPEVALRWADYFYTDEGSQFFYYGTEDVTFVRNADGTLRFSDMVLADFNAGLNSYDGSAAYVSLYAYGNTPTMTKIPFNSADDNRGISLEAANALIADCAIAWPSFTYTVSEQRVIDDTKRDIDSYVSSMRDSWIMGTTDLDDVSWQNYVNRVASMGLLDVLEVYEAALQRSRENGFKDGYYSLDDFN
ncbi:MAG: extracellular solute-binding protein [Lachnospiraceae bacterium]|nr:extracellular solute-binding protein [Lachnospiraceae bacterium]